MLKMSENKLHGETRILIDYLSYSIRYKEVVEDDSDFADLPPKDSEGWQAWLVSRLGFPGVRFEPRKGMYGYSSAVYYDGVVIAWGGNDSIFVQMSGTGCRTWEDLHPRTAWQQHIVDLRQEFKSLHFSRIDVACDTFGRLKLKTIQNYTRKEMYISRWKQYLIQEGVVENSVIWGSAKSDFRLRIYDKTQEREVKSGADPAEIPRDWVRCEFQLRNQAAESFIRSWLDCGDIGSTYRGIMRNQLLYVKCYDGKNRDRSVLARWWDKLLEDSEQIKMAYNVGKDYNFDSLKRYIFHQAGSSIQAYISICGGDIDPLLAGVYGAKLNDRQRELMRTMRGSV